MTTPREVPRWADPVRCPDCRAVLRGAPVCPSCGLVLEGPDAVRLFALLSEADGVLARMRRDGRSALDAVLPQEEAGSDAATDVDGGTAPPGTEQSPRRDGPRLPSASVPLVLLTVGALLLSVAALLFAAFTWFLLPELGRAVLLLGTAAGIGWGAWTVSRRRLRVAAEALWPLSAFTALVGLLLLGPGGGRAEAAWAVLSGLVLVAGALVATSVLRRHEFAVPRLLEATVLVLGAVTAAALTGLDPDPPLLASGSALPILGLAAVLAVLGLRSRLLLVSCGAAAAAGATWVAIVLVGSTTLLEGGEAVWSPVRYADLLVAIAIAALVAYVPLPPVLGSSVTDDLEAWARRVGAAAAAVVGVLLGAGATTGFSRATLAAEPHVNAAALVAGALLLVIALSSVVARDAAAPARRHRGQGLLGAYGIVAAVALLVIGVAASRALVQAGERSGPLPVDAGGLPADSSTAWWWAAPVLLAIVAATADRVADAYALGSPGGRAIPRPLAPPVLLVVAAGTAVAPVAPLWAVTLTLAAAVLVAAAAAYAVPTQVTVVALAGAAGILVATAAPSPWLLVAGLVLVALLAAAAACGVPGRHDTAPGRQLAVGAVAAGVAVASGAWALGVALPRLDVVPLTWRLLVVAAAGVWVLALGLLRRPLLHRYAAGAAALAATGAVVVGRSADDAAWLLLLSGILAVATTVTSTDDDAPGWVGSLLLLGASAARWIAGGAPPEAVSLSAGAVLLALGGWQLRRRPEASSLRVLAPALALALTPSLLLSLAQPLGLRTLLVMALAAAALGWGAVGGLSAPLLAGGGALLLLGLRLLGPVSSVLPWWIVAGGIGTVLVLVGVTWESRRAEVDAATRYVRRLR